MKIPDSGKIRVGIVGDLHLNTNQEAISKQYINQILTLIKRNASEQPIEIVSQHVYTGIPRLAYEKAAQHDYTTLGISCKKAAQYPRYEVDISHVVGTTWHETIQTFLNNVHILIIIGDENISERFYSEAKKRFFQVFKCSFKNAEQKPNSPQNQQKASCDDD